METLLLDGVLKDGLGHWTSANVAAADHQYAVFLVLVSHILVCGTLVGRQSDKVEVQMTAERQAATDQSCNCPDQLFVRIGTNAS